MWNFLFDLQSVPTVLNGTFIYCQETTDIPICRVISLLEQNFLLLITFFTYVPILRHAITRLIFC